MVTHSISFLRKNNIKSPPSLVEQSLNKILIKKKVYVTIACAFFFFFLTCGFKRPRNLKPLIFSLSWIWLHPKEIRRNCGFNDSVIIPIWQLGQADKIHRMWKVHQCYSWSHSWRVWSPQTPAAVGSRITKRPPGAEGHMKQTREEVGVKQRDGHLERIHQEGGPVPRAQEHLQLQPALSSLQAQLCSLRQWGS